MNLLRLLLHVLVFRPLLYLIFGIHVTGQNNLHSLKNFILFSNHNSHLDIFLLYYTLPPSMINRSHAVAALDYFRKPAWLYRAVQFLFQPIWVDRTTYAGSMIKEIEARLKQGHSIIIFPEGTRGQDGSLQEFQAGIGLVAKRNPGIPCIPAFLEGPERSFPKKAPFPLPLCNHVTIGPPQRLDGDIKTVTFRLHDHLKTLADEELAYRQRRPLSPGKPATVSVIGIDGSGKSTLSRALIRHSSGESCFVGDSLERYHDGIPYPAQPLVMNEIRQWMGHRAKHAENLSGYKIPKMAELLLRDRLLNEVIRWYRPERIVMDGSPLLNMTAWAVLYREQFFNASMCMKTLSVLTGNRKLKKRDPMLKQFPELKILNRLHLNQLHMPDMIVFLDVEPQLCLERIQSRGEKLQAHENPEQLAKLRDAYTLVCEVLAKTHHVLHLKGDRPVKTLVQETNQIMENLQCKPLT
ncbi:1-acyl-sn-glycerol-3-phosphate acyltransferase [bacterium]|nr:1-acyl-sn-glycerol-3-phosphate acyltransferase [bacterium]